MNSFTPVTAPTVSQQSWQAFDMIQQTLNRAEDPLIAATGDSFPPPVIVKQAMPAIEARVAQIDQGMAMVEKRLRSLLGSARNLNKAIKQELKVGEISAGTIEANQVQADYLKRVVSKFAGKYLDLAKTACVLAVSSSRQDPDINAKFTAAAQVSMALKKSYERVIGALSQSELLKPLCKDLKHQVQSLDKAIKPFEKETIGRVVNKPMARRRMR